MISVCYAGPLDGHVHTGGDEATEIIFDGFEDQHDTIVVYMITERRDNEGRTIFQYEPDAN
jgi:hypothetical protein